ncbi:MAG: SDR family oxidoreductase [Burkholderiales bacterium]
MSRILVTGGAGYVGHVLVPQLLDDRHEIVVYDTFWFGDALPDNPKLKRVKADLRDVKAYAEAVKGCDTVIHLACISNDTSFALDEKLSTTINLHAFKPLLKASEDAGIRLFINASTSSVYGVSDAPEVFEDHPKVPLTLYNRYKWECEEVLAAADPKFTWVTIRPATVCGYSPRCRLDLSVNILTNHAVNKGKITVFGGAQKRPNLHIQDMVDAYKLLLRLPAAKIDRRTYNCGFQNQTIQQIAESVKKVVEKEFPERAPIQIEVTESDDKRSYHINSDKIRRELGFSTKYTIEDAVRDLCKAFRQGKLPNSFDDDAYYNVRKLKALKVS